MSSPIHLITPIARSAAPATDRVESRRATRLLWRSITARPRDLLAAGVLTTTHQLGEAMVPVIIGAAIDLAVDHGAWTSIALWLGVLGADFAVLSLSYRFGARAAMRARQQAAHQVRMELTERVVRPTGGIDLPPGELLSRASSDADRIGAFAGVVASTFAAAVALLLATAALLASSPVLGGVIIIGTGLLLALQAALARHLHRRSVAEQQALARATTLAEDIVRGLRVLAGIGADHAAAAEFRRVSRDAVTAAQDRAGSQARLSAAGQLLTGLYLAVIAGVGGSLALSGGLGLGALVSALGLAQFVVGPMQVLAGAPAAGARALACARRVQQVLATPELLTESADRPGGACPTGPTTAGAVHLDQVRSGPLRIDLRLDAGTLTGLVCGDPGMAERVPLLLAREVDPESGTIRLDGVDIATLPLNRLRGRLLVALHDAALLPGTIQDNLAVLSNNADAVDRAAAAAVADQVVQVVPQGSAAHVGDHGELLSGGQRQRIALARVLAADPSVLVLHEPTTAVDPITEDALAHRVARLRRGRTTLVLTSSPAWLARCDRVYFLGTGGVTGGTHATLLRGCAEYRSAVAR